MEIQHLGCFHKEIPKIFFLNNKKNVNFLKKKLNHYFFFYNIIIKLVSLNYNKRIIGEFQKFNFKNIKIINLTNNKKIKFFNINHLTNYRLKTFFTKRT